MATLQDLMSYDEFESIVDDSFRNENDVLDTIGITFVRNSIEFTVSSRDFYPEMGYETVYNIERFGQNIYLFAKKAKEKTK